MGQFGGEGVLAGIGKAFIADPADLLGLPWQVLVFDGEAPDPCNPGSRWARAMAVTGDDDPAVVIETGRDGTCVYSDCQGSEDSRCFVSAGVLEDLGDTPVFSSLDRAVCVTGGPEMPSTFAYDAERRTVVIEEVEVDEIVLAGRAWQAPRSDTCGLTQEAACQDGVRPLRFQPFIEVLETLGDAASPPRIRHSTARGVQVQGTAVGFSFAFYEGEEEEIDCQQEAVLWPAGSSSLVRLHDAVDAVAFHSRAESINRASFLMQIVGWDLVQAIPLFWRLPAYASMTNSGAWEGWRLLVGGGSGTVDIECDDCDRPGDLDEDGEIGFSDLLLLLANWGPCGHACAWCPWDLDGNRDVGFSDLLILSSNWGMCGQQAQGLPQSVQDCIARVGYDPVALSACIATIE